MPQKSVFHWNAKLRSYCKQKMWKETLHLFCHMKKSTVVDNYTVLVVLKACSKLSAYEIGKQIYAVIILSDLMSDMFVGAALIDLYSKCGFMDDAYGLFTRYHQPDVVLWTSMVSGYQQNGTGKKALDFFSRMVFAGISPDTITLISALSACTQLGNINGGKSCHTYVLKWGLGSNLALYNALLNQYVKLGSMDSAVNVFDGMPHRDVISWSTIIGGYVQSEQAADALATYGKMIGSGIEPNHVTVVCALQACAGAQALEEGKRIHEFSIRKGLEMQNSVATSLVDMYMKCNCVDEATEVFTRMPNKDVVAWAALIGGYAMNDLSHRSLTAFCSMLSVATRPDAVIIVKVLSSCAQSGTLQQAECLHSYLIQSGFDQKVFVGASLVDMYAKCGSLGNSVQVFHWLQEKDVVSWSSIIAAYGIHGFGLESLAQYERMLLAGLKPNHVTFISVLSACSHSGLIDPAVMIFNSMIHEYNVMPCTEHYACMVDLLGRTGRLDEALWIISSMPVKADSQVWGALLGACRIHQNVELGELAADNLFHLDPNHRGYYVLLSNLYADGARWDGVVKVRTMMKSKTITRVAGISTIEIGNKRHSFMAGDRSEIQSQGISDMLESLEVMMKEEGCFPDCDLSSRDNEVDVWRSHKHFK